MEGSGWRDGLSDSESDDLSSLSDRWGLEVRILPWWKYGSSSSSSSSSTSNSPLVLVGLNLTELRVRRILKVLRGCDDTRG